MFIETYRFLITEHYLKLHHKFEIIKINKFKIHKFLISKLKRRNYSKMSKFRNVHIFAKIYVYIFNLLILTISNLNSVT